MCNPSSLGSCRHIGCFSKSTQRRACCNWQGVEVFLSTENQVLPVASSLMHIQGQSSGTKRFLPAPIATKFGNLSPKSERDMSGWFVSIRDAACLNLTADTSSSAAPGTSVELWAVVFNACTAVPISEKKCSQEWKTLPSYIGPLLATLWNRRIKNYNNGISRTTKQCVMEKKHYVQGVDVPYALFSSPKLLLWRLKMDGNSVFAFHCSLQLVLALTRSNSL